MSPAVPFKTTQISGFSSVDHPAAKLSRENGCQIRIDPPCPAVLHVIIKARKGCRGWGSNQDSDILSSQSLETP